MSPLAAPFHSPVAMTSALVALGLLSTATIGQTGPSDNGTRFYSTASPPKHYTGVLPAFWELATPPALSLASSPGSATEVPPVDAPVVPPLSDPAPTPADRLALADASAPVAEPADIPPAPDPISQAMEMILGCRERYRNVADYTCVFLKKERVDGVMTPLNILHMKARQKPHSVYFQFVQPTKGREAIYVHGQNGNKAWVHDVGIGRLLAGTISLDPRSGRAMDGNRHPINEAGIGFLIETVIKGWEAEMRDGETKVTVTPGILVDKRPCTLIVSHHPTYNRAYQFHEVRVYIDHEHGLPIRFEAYDWPRRPGTKGELLEEYTYTKLRLNTGLTDQDFSPSNQAYSFGRF